MTATLVVQDLRVGYGEEQPVLDGLGFELCAGAITVLLGPNASGKSSLILALAGLLPYEGSVKLSGRELSGYSPQTRAQHLAYVPQRSQLQSPLLVHKVVAMGQAFASRTDASAKVAQAMQQCQCLELAQRRFTELSGGQQQRVLLARALASGAKILLLDEPTSALDLRHALHFVELVQGLTEQGYTILWALHDLNLARRCAHRCLLLDKGQLRAHGTVSEVIVPMLVQAVYGVTMQEDAGLDFCLRSGKEGQA